jgi:chromosome segregation protein
LARLRSILIVNGASRLKLEKLEIYGFKSFADRTVFEFEDELSALVGPNGSGKSNVVDALRWVLGERSARKLRGADMASVIFNGSKGANARKPMNAAEVTLTIDNSKGWLPVEYDKVAIKRRVSRDGQGDYFINGKRCRAKDVRHLLMDTGMGTSSYSFIEQGQIARLLTASPTERRAVFEEAAGIHRFLEQKREAERKLDRVTVNLARVGDIIDELARQLRSVKYQAGRARTFRKHVQRLQELRLAGSLHDLRRYELDRARHRGLITEADARKLSITEAASAAEAELEAARTELGDAQGRLSDARERLSAATARVQGLAGEAGANRRRAEDLQSQLDELEGRRGALELQADGLENDIGNARQTLADTMLEIKAKTQIFEERRRQMDAARLTARQSEQSLEAAKSDVFKLLQEQSRIHNQIEMVAGEHRAVGARRERIENRRRELDEQLGAAESDARAAQQRLVACNADQQRLSGEMAGLRDSIGEAARRLEELSTREADVQAQLSGKRGRQDVLDDLERRAEGVGAGVQLLRQAGLSGMMGIVAELLDVPREYAAVIEAALETRVQAVVFERASDAEAAMQLLADSDAGRAELIVLEHVATPALADPPPGMKRLSDLVGFSDKLAPAIHLLLGNAFLAVDTASALSEMSSGLSPNVRIITPTGQCFRPAGVWSGGTPETPSLISRRSELTELQAEISALEVDRDKLTAQRAESADRLRQLDAERDDLARNIEQITRDLAEAESTTKISARRMEDLRAEIALGRKELEALDADVVRLNARRSELEADARGVGERHAAAEHEVQAHRDALQDVQQKQHDLGEQVSVLSNELAGARERQANLQVTVERRQTDHRRLIDELDKFDARVERNTIRRDEARQAVRVAETEADALQQEQAQLTATIDAEAETVTRVRDGIAALAEQNREASAEREAVEESLQALRLAEQETEIKTQDLLERSADEYGVHLPRLEMDAEMWRETPLFTTRPIREFMEIEDEPEPEPEQVADWYAEMLGTQPAAADEEAEPTAAAPNEQAPEPVLLEDAVTLRDAVLALVNDEATDWTALRAELAKLKSQVERIGNVNVGAIAEQEKLESRLAYLTEQRDDLDKAKRTERELIRELNKKSRERFRETFDQVRANFQVLFRKLFGGGNADIVLDEEAEDILEAGIDMIVRPPGKETNSLSLLSGGEQALTTVALLFAMFQRKPSPFCLLDEVDAPLDDSNVERFLGMLSEFQKDTQFIIITHNKLTMQAGQALCGLTMTDGVTQKISVRLETVEDQLGLDKPDLAKAG